MSDVVLDASAALAVLLQEPGREVVEHAMTTGRAVISTVNLSEVITILLNNGAPLPAAAESAIELGARRIELTSETAIHAAGLRPLTRSAGLGLGDRVCLALGIELDADILTADRSWASLGIGARVRVIR